MIGDDLEIQLLDGWTERRLADYLTDELTEAEKEKILRVKGGRSNEHHMPTSIR